MEGRRRPVALWRSHSAYPSTFGFNSSRGVSARFHSHFHPFPVIRLVSYPPNPLPQTNTVWYSDFSRVPDSQICQSIARPGIHAEPIFRVGGLSGGSCVWVSCLRSLITWPLSLMNDQRGFVDKSDLRFSIPPCAFLQPPYCGFLRPPPTTAGKIAAWGT